MTAADLAQILRESSERKRRERIAQRVQAGAALAFVVACVIALAVVMVDLIVWRP